MRLLPVIFLKCFLVAALIAQCTNCFSQGFDSLNTKSIEGLEAAIREHRTLLLTQQELEAVKKHALESHNDILLARSLYNLMKIRDQRTEDTLYFRNSAFIDTLLHNNISPKLQAILLVMRAQRLSNFDSRPMRFNYAAYRVKNVKPDYAAFTHAQRDSIVKADLDAELQYHKPDIDGKELLWLSSSPDVFLFDPNFEDIVLAERINLLAASGYNNDGSGTIFAKWLPLTSAAFINKLDSLAAHAKNSDNVLVAYQHWLSFHKNNQAVSTLIESLIRKNIYLSAPGDTSVRQPYIKYLQTSIASPFAAVKAHAVYQLCLIWNEDGNKYARLDNRYIYNPLPNFDPKYQYYPARALQLYNQNKELMAKYPLFNNVLDLMAQQIKLTGIRIEMEDHSLPEKDIPIRVIYKNADKLFYRIIRISSIAATGAGIIPPTTQLLNRQPIAQGDFVLPLPPDNNRHAAYLKLKQLPVGHYRLLFGNSPIKADNKDVYNMAFDVTGITAINTDEKVFALDRKTGFPMIGAQVKAFYKKAPLGIAATVNNKCYIDFKEDIADSISITCKGDTTGYKFSVHKNELRAEVYSKGDYDNLADFYRNKLRMEIFTDRSIYRPGQTVHYKIIFLTNDPNTGNPILFNAKTNLKEWLHAPNNEITFQDPFRKKTDSATITINEFGSFAGSFIVPKTAATGKWQINGGPETNYQNGGSFRVEEYKRPTIELNMEKQTKILLPGQPFTIKLKLRSFNGADLGNVPVAYTISRNGSMPSQNSRLNIYANVTLTSKTGYTNAKGELLIAVNDSTLAKAILIDSVAWNYNYGINATATDATGESTGLNENINISSRPVRINVPLVKTYDRQALPILAVNTTADFEGVVGRKVNIKLYKTSDPASGPGIIKPVDQWYYNKSDWNTWFPDKAYTSPLTEEKTLVLDTVINTSTYEKFALPKDKCLTGFYQLYAQTKENGKITGQASYTFNVFDSKTNEIPVDDIDYMPFNTVKPGDILTWYSSGKSKNYTLYHILYVGGNKKRVISNIYETRTEEAGIRIWKYKIPTDATGQVTINRITVRDNKIERHTKTVYLTSETQALDIIVEKYRKVMAPGAQETFTLSVKTKNDNVAAELMTTLYDASLDKLENHRWALPETNPRPYYLNDSWGNSLTTTLRLGDYTEDEQSVIMREIRTKPGDKFSMLLAGHVAGISITEASGLSEVVVIGYGERRRMDLTGAATIIRIRGVSSLQDYNQPLIIMDGEIFSGDLKNINQATISQIMVLKGADASAIYGARAANGVLIISTKGPIILSGSEEPVIKVRKNFNETAFFFPQVHAGTDGYYTFSFTMPETATEWNWKMLAHTRSGKFAYLEKKLQTQLNLMVQPNMPRLLYQGDKITLQSRVTNLDTVAIQGKATCKIEDALTGEDISAVVMKNNTQAFNLGKKSSGAVSFSLRIPAGQSNPLKIVIAATSAGAADAEEHIIPVLSTRVFTRQSQAIHFKDQPVITLSPVKLPADASLYGVGISIAQKPQASLIYALPWLANYSYDCAEQSFNKLRAKVVALKLMQKDTSAQNAFKKAATSIEKDKVKDNQLHDELANEAMPWLSVGNHAAQQQKQLFHLLDTSVTKAGINQHLDKLFKLQQPDGGLTWFEGGNSNSYISAYVLAGFGQLKQLGWVPEPQRVTPQNEFINSLAKYEENLLSNTKAKTYDQFQIYAIGYWLKENPLPAALSEKVKSILNTEWGSINNKSLGQQTLLVINTLRYYPAGSVLNVKAQKQLENIRQLAIEDTENGIRWKDIADSEDLNSSAEETMALLAEAFELSGKYKEIQTGIVKWLLTIKQDEHWQTTKATAAAIYLLQKDKGTTFGETKAFSTQIDGHELSVSDGLLGGVPTSLAKTQQIPQSIAIKQQGTNVSGSLTWYYFAEPSKLDTLNKAVKLTKEFYTYDINKGWIKLMAGTILKTGDQVRVKLIIETNARLKFVHINDPRAAAFEPKENNSGYQYNNGFSYYRSVRDTGSDLFAEAIPKGISEITYELVVAHGGEFFSGPATLQCMYQPAITTYSGTEKIKTN